MPGLSHYNPFQQIDLQIPEAYHDDVTKYSRTFTGGGKPDPENSPFDRYVDVWMVALCLGAVEALESGAMPQPDVKKWHKFNVGSVLQGDATRIELLELLAIAVTNDPFVIESPNKVVEIANTLAAAGLPRVIDMLQSGHGKPLWNITHHLIEVLKKSPPAAGPQESAPQTL